ncbi:MAG: hypothetical protein HKN57_08845 [Xanthomonadales bacterium]|nr:hypothetical protein [Gammaproteobacteria bacterium]MBT8053640.1 hypothetical protein [Gammaproteobacteria bacterium]NND57348.1 hypothetical protein [Xanthomonadales bacterium]NNK51785.1 hypothetical protein [Xanthomonadales bacterium]
MTHNLISESTIDASIDAYLHGAKTGDVKQAKRLHEMLEQMLIGRELPEGQMWLTNHGREVLADMHAQLSKCDDCDERLRDVVLDAVRLGPRKGNWHDTSSFFHDLQIATTVANELCVQREEGLAQNVELAAQTIAEGGKFDLTPNQINAIYDAIADTVEGFKEI